jgi:hypothetical protein
MLVRIQNLLINTNQIVFITPRKGVVGCYIDIDVNNTDLSHCFTYKTEQDAILDLTRLITAMNPDAGRKDIRSMIDGVFVSFDELLTSVDNLTSPLEAK